MAEYVFKSNERFAVFTVHGEKCYICNEPLVYSSTEVDHVIPEHLDKDPDQLAKVLGLLGRPDTFRLNGYENWLPACRRCNGRKQGRVWDPSLLVQLCLQMAADKAAEVREMAERELSRREYHKALSVLERYLGNDDLSDEVSQRIVNLLDVQQNHRDKRLRDEPVVISPEYSVMVEKREVKMTRSLPVLHRRLALLQYDFACAITGPTEPSVLEMASILPIHQKPDLFVDIRGFLVLRSDVHRLFDLGRIAIDPTTLTVLVSEKLKDSVYASLHGKAAFLPSDPQYMPDLQLLAEHISHAQTRFMSVFMSVEALSS